MAVTSDEPGAVIVGVASRAPTGRNRLAARFPGVASGQLEVAVGEEPGAWLKERLAGASSDAQGAVVDGRVVYMAAKPGIDRIYEVTGQRVEEYLRIADARAAADLAYEIDAGPAIADLVVDGSGAGLVAVDAEGHAVVKAPAPHGVDVKGAPVQGRLVAARTGEHRFSVQVRIVGEPGAVSFPVLLDPGWVATGSLGTKRYEHTATILGNGKVLVAGGDNAAYLASAELYDPVAGTWAATGPLATARRYHTATLLGNGKVLVAGGVGNSGALASAELYDPVAGTWAATGSLGTARYEHTATLLGNGEVLVAGGYNPGYLASAELYDPVAGTWTATGPLATARYVHTATLLGNGEVLVAGGYNPGYLASAELYDPAAGTWAATGPLATARYYHTATLLGNGKVLVAGGSNGGGTLASAELYDPVAGTWAATDPLATARDFHTATLLANGAVLVAGGINGVSWYLASAELYDPVAGTWAATGPLATARYLHTATLLGNGKVLVAGGFGSGFLASAELYALGDNGSACAAAGQCSSNFCVDGVCCDTACGGGVATDCQSCKGVLTGGLDGTCGTVTAAAAFACRASAGACDLAETCDGTGSACPADAKLASGTVCRVSAGACDVAESCDGATNGCPVDGFQPASTVCRVSAGACDVAETCTGASTACPADAKVAAGIVCRVSAGACDVAESCDGSTDACPADGFAPASTPCDDGDLCTQSDSCQAGVCTGSNPVVCLAKDQCHEMGTCAPATGICADPPRAEGAMCDDGNPCTQTDACVSGACIGQSPKTCDATDDCHVAGTCDATTGACSHPAKADGEACSLGTCQAGSCTASPDGGTGGSGGETGTGGGAGGPTPGATVGCGCRVAGDEGETGGTGGMLALGALAVVLASRRRRAA
jgi:MYXO-CTERM domain-containing protein